MTIAVSIPLEPKAISVAKAPDTIAPTYGTYDVTSVTTAMVNASGMPSTHAVPPISTAVTTADSVSAQK